MFEKLRVYHLNLALSFYTPHSNKSAFSLTLSLVKTMHVNTEYMYFIKPSSKGEVFCVETTSSSSDLFCQ